MGLSKGRCSSVAGFVLLLLFLLFCGGGRGGGGGGLKGRQTNLFSLCFHDSCR